MAAQDLEFDGQVFDVIFNRHGPVFVAPILRVLKPGGDFICRQVGGLNTRNIFQLFGWESSGAYWRQYWDEHGFEHQDAPSLTRTFSVDGCRVVLTGSYNVPGGRVEISTRGEGNKAVVSIANTGPVIPPEHVHRIFAPFQRLGRPRRPPPRPRTVHRPRHRHRPRRHGHRERAAAW